MTHLNDARPVRRNVHALRTAACLVVAGLLAACSDTGTSPSTDAKHIVVLDGFVQPGYTLVSDTGTATSRIALGSPSEFDGGGFVLQHDTALAVSSKGAGDVLFVTDIAAGTVRKVQMPVASNPAKARLLTGGNGAARIAVALRDSGMVAIVTIPATGSPTITRITGVGVCPTDMFRNGDALWVVDANANCKVDYAALGPTRLIRVPDVGTARDTINLTTLRGSAADAIVLGDTAIIAAGGDADFGSFPGTLIASGALARVNLATKSILQQQSMPTGSYGASMRLGLDGKLYVSAYENLTTFANRVLQLRTHDLTNYTTSGTWLAFRDKQNAAVNCGATVGDAIGRLYCLVNGAASATTMVVFDPTGNELRRAAAGQGGVDIAFRSNKN